MSQMPPSESDLGLEAMESIFAILGEDTEPQLAQPPTMLTSPEDGVPIQLVEMDTEDPVLDGTITVRVIEKENWFPGYHIILEPSLNGKPQDTPESTCSAGDVTLQVLGEDGIEKTPVPMSGQVNREVAIAAAPHWMSRGMTAPEAEVIMIAEELEMRSSEENMQSEKSKNYRNSPTEYQCSKRKGKEKVIQRKKKTATEEEEPAKNRKKDRAVRGKLMDVMRDQEKAMGKRGYTVAQQVQDVTTVQVTSLEVRANVLKTILKMAETESGQKVTLKEIEEMEIPQAQTERPLTGKELLRVMIEIIERKVVDVSEDSIEALLIPRLLMIMGRWWCPFCHSSCVEMKTLRKHVRDHHLINRWSCQCGLFLGSRMDLMKHLEDCPLSLRKQPLQEDWRQLLVPRPLRLKNQ